MLSLDGNAGALKLDGNKIDINGSQALKCQRRQYSDYGNNAYS